MTQPYFCTYSKGLLPLFPLIDIFAIPQVFRSLHHIHWNLHGLRHVCSDECRRRLRVVPGQGPHAAHPCHDLRHLPDGVLHIILFLAIHAYSVKVASRAERSTDSSVCGGRRAFYLDAFNVACCSWDEVEGQREQSKPL